MNIFFLANVTRVYGRRTVLDVPALEIEEGRIHALLGPNGAGKTTLLNILGFLESPTSGRVAYRSQPIPIVEAELQKLRREVVLVDQHPILFSTTVYKNLEFGLKIRGIQPDNRRRIIEETLDLVGMRSFIRSPAHQLSGGETQRVALARGLALSPRVLLCDEPTSSVDVENQTIIVNILRRINELRKITVIFTSHDRTQAAGLAHQILVLDQGRLVPTTYENIFSGRLYSSRNGQARCRIQKNISLAVPPEQVEAGHENIRVFIDPAQIDIAVDDNSGESIPNTFQGRVVQLMAENEHIRVVIDAGILITLLLGKSRYRQTHPLVGDVLSLTIPSDTIKFL